MPKNASSSLIFGNTHTFEYGILCWTLENRKLELYSVKEQSAHDGWGMRQCRSVSSISSETKCWLHLQDSGQMWTRFSFMYVCTDTSSHRKHIRAVQINNVNVTLEQTDCGITSLPLRDDRRIKLEAWNKEVELIWKGQRRNSNLVAGQGSFLGTLRISQPCAKSGSLKKWLTGCSGTSRWITHSKPQ